jgi:hypothetical protein
MIEHDCNPAARQAGYPVGEEHDPDPPALEHGAGRDLTCQPYPGATATPRGLTGRALAGLNAEYRTGTPGPPRVLLIGTESLLRRSLKIAGQLLVRRSQAVETWP